MKSSSPRNHKIICSCPTVWAAEDPSPFLQQNLRTHASGSVSACELANVVHELYTLLLKMCNLKKKKKKTQ